MVHGPCFIRVWSQRNIWINNTGSLLPLAGSENGSIVAFHTPIKSHIQDGLPPSWPHQPEIPFGHPILLRSRGGLRSFPKQLLPCVPSFLAPKRHVFGRTRVDIAAGERTPQPSKHLSPNQPCLGLCSPGSRGVDAQSQLPLLFLCSHRCSFGQLLWPFSLQLPLSEWQAMDGSARCRRLPLHRCQSWGDARSLSYWPSTSMSLSSLWLCNPYKLTLTFSSYSSSPNQLVSWDKTL